MPPRFRPATLLGAFLLTPALVFASDLPTVQVEDDPNAPVSLTLLGIDRTLDGKPRGVFVVKNLSGEEVRQVSFVAEAVGPKGELAGVVAVSLRLRLAAGADAVVARALPTELLPEEGRWWIRPEVTRPGDELGYSIGSCTNFCEKCGDRAGTLCTGGVQEMSCSCDDTGSTCTIKCFAPRV